jgi:MoaA/NifB/PqqE/SkfB family radical SAM enzyme
MEEFDADIDETGRLILPPELVKQFGLNPGTKIRISKNANGMHLRPPLTRLTNVYRRMYFYRYERSIKRHTVGNVLERSIQDIWNRPEYLSFRVRLRDFDFSPCVLCGGCDYFESNQEDCVGSPAPACGGAYGLRGSSNVLRVERNLLPAAKKELRL